MRKYFRILLLALVLGLTAASCSPAELPPLEGEPADLAREFISGLAGGDYEGCFAYFNVKMGRAMKAKKLEKVWTDLQAQVGPYRGETELREDVADGYDVVNVTSEFENDPLVIRIVFDGERRVAGLWFLPVE